MGWGLSYKVLPDEPAGPRRVTLTLAGGAVPGVERRLAVRDALRTLLGGAPDEVELLPAPAGPTVDLDLSVAAAGRLRALLREGGRRLALLKVEQLQLDRGESVFERWTAREGRFHLQETVYPPAESRTRPLEFRLFAPLVVALMLGCLAWSLGGLFRLLLPDWSSGYIVVGVVLAALEAPYSLRVIRVRRIFSTDVYRFRATELAVFLILLRAAAYWGSSLPEIWADIRSWPLHPLAILPLGTIVAFVVVLLAWVVAGATANDMERLGEPPERSPHYVPPFDSLVERFFGGGFLLVVVAGLTIIGLHLPAGDADAVLASLRTGSHRALALNVLLYFVLGLVMLGQVRLGALHQRWLGDGIPVDRALVGRWARISLIIIVLAAVLAFVLPTGYSGRVLLLIGQLLYWVAAGLSYLVSLLVFLLGGLISLIVSLLFRGGERSEPTTEPPRFEPPPVAAHEVGVTPEWVLLMRTILFWTLLLAGVILVLRAYLRDHPELGQALGRFRPLRGLRALWALLRRWLARWKKTVRETLPRLLPRRATPRVARPRLPWLRLRSLSASERVQFYFWRLLQQAGELGLPRRPAETPSEYAANLSPMLPEAQDELDELTAAFLTARYGRRPVPEAAERAVRRDWAAVKQDLRRLAGLRRPPEP